jgi:hypothetical protein
MGDLELYAIAEKYFRENHEGEMVSLKIHKNEVFIVHRSLSGEIGEILWENPPTNNPVVR